MEIAPLLIISEKKVLIRDPTIIKSFPCAKKRKY